jgi:GT2 family glycosyltransferase
MIQTPQVAVIMVNYNGYALTRDCLASFAKVTWPGNYVLIVVDNASVDDPLPRLQREFPNVLYVESKTNLGFTGGNNLGLAAAYKLGVKYVFFLNNDTVVSENIFNLVNFLETNRDVGMVAPLTFYHDNPATISFGGGQLDRNTGRITSLNKGITRSEMSTDVVYCSFLEGAAIMARADLIRRAGGFNDDYFLNSEEAELCVKVADLGYRLALIKSCSVWHKISQTMGSGSELINYFVYRNRLHFIKNNARGFGVSDLVGIVRNYLITFFSLTLKVRNIPAARGLVLGLIDFLRGVKGVGRYRQRLQPKSSGGVSLS